MADAESKAPPAGGASAGSSKPPKPPNPVWRMMGLPNIRMRLPSRNWMIFLGITGSWTAAVVYDRREKRRIQRKWTKLVEHIASETLDDKTLPRRLTVYLSAPPADGLVPARDHFHEYVKPILVAAALDWDAIEGRREGDVRAGLAEKIRRLRKVNGEPSDEPLEADLQLVLDEARRRSGVHEFDGVPGDIVIGRHTWKEYVRGLHEGWLGPLNPPKAPVTEEPFVPVAETPSPDPTPVTTLEAVTATESTSDDASPTATPEAEKPKEEEKPKEDESKSKKKKQPPPFNTTADYGTSTLSPNCPAALGPAAVIPLPHLLGFFNFPIRMYRFLNRRQVADDIGRQTAAAVLAAYRPFDAAGASASDSGDAVDQWEQQKLLAHEEPDWHKTVRERKEDDDRERTWLDDMVLDPRIAERMRRFQLNVEDEERANRLSAENEKESAWWKGIWPKSEEKKNLWEGLEDTE
ncbi:hypothetical protein BU24DRAFT_385980 [Aaosphaeria arxii CBS 175.79]|uniref:Mitochondrial import inner membrane translocase subunit TIM54 n=1 Tax=Aaosphaeria arxii CBS 175.79 TaxID=1450172 RepID=A0A6A5Y2W0_9PLEO|nr:uncharacterized protein BU24DRAFT_385980 [Aaosphaeria arxii CBS 175.79]KAF2019140.1 hypothetical protein BU24DRAFT_385980 [Aaosphaeria arxii CBS 175.79]